MTDLKIAREDGPQAAVPDLWINATSLSSGRQWVFTPTQMGTIGVSRKRSSWRDVKTEEPIDFLALLKLLDDTVEYREIPGALREFPVGRAVAASACVPGVFPPIKLRFLPWRGGKAAIHLVDGGLIDNLGLRPLEGCPSTVVSDASAPLSHDIKGISKSTFGGLWSSFGALFTFSQAASKQLWEEFLTRKETDIPRHHINLSLAEFRGTIKGVDDSVKKAIINIRTDLDLFTDVEGYALMYAGYQIASGNEKLENLARPDKTEPWPFLVVAEEVKKKNVRNKLLASRSRLKSVRILPVVAWVMILAVVLFLGSNWVVAKLSPDSVREHGLLVGPVLLAEATIVLAILWTVIWFLAACAIAATSWATFLLGRFLLWRDRIPIVSEYDLDANG